MLLKKLQIFIKTQPLNINLIVQFMTQPKTNHNTNPLLLIDAHNIIYRAYYALPILLNPHTQNVNGLFGFIKTLLKLIKLYATNNILVAFDHPSGSTPRKSILDTYKSNRSIQPEEVSVQISQAKKFCELMGLNTLSIEFAETDDVINTLVQLYRNIYNIKIVSNDKDMFHLLSNRVSIIDPKDLNSQIYTKDIEEKFGVPIKQLLLLFCMTGDASDKVAGIPGIGPKRASKIINDFPSITNIEDLISIIPKQHKYYTQIQNHKDLLHKNVEVLSLKYIPNLQDILLSCTQLDHQGMLAFLNYHGFNSLKPKLIQPTLLVKPQPCDCKIQIEMDTDKDKLTEWILNNTTIIIPIISNTREIGSSVILLYDSLGILYKITPHSPIHILHTVSKRIQCSKKFFTYNIKDLIILCHNYGIQYNGIYHDVVFDIRIAIHLLNSNNNLILDSILSSLINTPNDSLSIDVKIKTAITHGSFNDFIQKTHQNILDQHLYEALYKIETPVSFVLARMELNGVFIDADIIHNLARTIKKELDEKKSVMNNIINKNINWLSPKQVHHVLIHDLQITLPNKKTTNHTFLKTISHIHAIIPLIIDYRSVYKIYSTYLTRLPTYINTKTHRVHPTFDQLGTSTGRISCKNPNMQNIPHSSSTLSNQICDSFIPKNKDYAIIDVDYAQIEMRVLAHFCKDKELVDIFLKNKDVHTSTAAMIFEIPYEQVSREQRVLAKTINFGVVYGQTGYGLSLLTHLSKQQSNEFINLYFKKFPGISLTIANIVEEARTFGYVSTLWGRKRYLTHINSNNPTLRKQHERYAINTVIQGSASMLFKYMLINMQEMLDKKYMGEALLVLNIHDEILIETPTKHIPHIINDIKAIMETLPISIPTPVTIKTYHSYKSYD